MVLEEVNSSTMLLRAWATQPLLPMAGHPMVLARADGVGRLVVGCIVSAPAGQS